MMTPTPKPKQPATPPPGWTPEAEEADEADLEDTEEVLVEAEPEQDDEPIGDEVDMAEEPTDSLDHVDTLEDDFALLAAQTILSSFPKSSSSTSPDTKSPL